MSKQTAVQTSASDSSAEYIGRIHSQYASFSKAQKRIANYVLNHQDEVIHQSITTLARKTNTAPSTITRFCQTLSYEGFSELKVYVAKRLLPPNAYSSPITSNDNLPETLQKLANSSQSAVIDTLRTLNPKMVAKAVDALLAANRIVFFGQSGGYISALYGQQILLRASVISHVYNDNVDAEIVASNLGPRDVAIGIGYSGEAKGAVKEMLLARHQGARVIAITATPNSSMDKAAHYTLFYSHDIPDDVRYLHLGTMCEISVLGALQAEILRRPKQRERVEISKNAVLNNRLK